MSRWLVLTLAIAVLCASCGRRPPPPRPAPPPDPEPVAPPPDKFGGQKVTDTGPIMFVCQGGGKHEEKEVLISRCPSCGANEYFVAFENAFWCYKCEKKMDSTTLKCAECGFVPTKVRLKRR